MNKITVEDIIKVLCPGYVKQTVSKTECKTECNKEQITIDGFELQSEHDNLLDCIIEYYGKKSDDIVRYLSTATINKNINKRKLAMMIRNGNINNELLLFFSGYFDCNIWIYHEINKIFKVYYLEEHYQKDKENLFIFDKGDKYHIGQTKINMIEMIKEIKEKYIAIPIGIMENQTWKEGKSEMNPLYKDIEMELTNICPIDPYPYPRFNIMRFLATLKI